MTLLKESKCEYWNESSVSVYRFPVFLGKRYTDTELPLKPNCFHDKSTRTRAMSASEMGSEMGQ